MSTTTLIRPETKPSSDRTGNGGWSFGHGGDSGNGDFGNFREWTVPPRTYRLAMWFALTCIVMLFAAFTSALVVRKGLSDDWVSFPMPRLLWLNTAVLLASSGTLELSRRGLARASKSGFLTWLYASAFLGLLFIAGQLAAWRELAARGVILATNPSSSFFYLLTAAHGVHLLGGIAALTYLLVRARRIALGVQRRTAVDVTAIYWHFMDGLWIYILYLLVTRF